MTIKLDKEFYNKRVLLKTAFQFIDRAYIHLTQDERFWYAEWKAKQGHELLPEEFENALIEETLRLQVVQETQDIRKLLLARAFASTLIETPSKTQDENEQLLPDDKGIMRGWYDEQDSKV